MAEPELPSDGAGGTPRQSAAAGVLHLWAPLVGAALLGAAALGAILFGENDDPEPELRASPPIDAAPAPAPAPAIESAVESGVDSGVDSGVESVAAPPPAAAVAGAAPLPTLAPILEAVTPAVVNISTVAAPRRTSPLQDDPFFRRFQQRRPRSGPTSLGSGVIVDAAEGLVITNEHVVAAAERVLVTLADGRELEATRVGSDPEADIAVVRIEADGLTELAWADSDALRVGDYCIAIGNPFGLGQTVTSGIVSALGRSGLGIEEYEDFIQTDASINPGNSGGALIALDGRLIGINTAIVGPAGGNVGIGFAIPANLARDLLEQIVETGEVRRGALGITAQALTPGLADALDVDADAGVVIADVRDGSPAEEAGLRPGDVIVAIDGRSVEDVGDVRNRIGLVRLGQRLALSVLRDGEPTELEAVVAALQLMNPLLDGVEFRDLRTRRGRAIVAIAEVDPDSRSARAGLARGDIVVSVGGVNIASVAELEAVADRFPDEIVLGIQRGRALTQVRIRG